MYACNKFVQKPLLGISSDLDEDDTVKVMVCMSRE
jgi:hypothetical protein